MAASKMPFLAPARRGRCPSSPLQDSRSIVRDTCSFSLVDFALASIHVRHREGLAFLEEFGGTFDERNMRSQLLICAPSREIGRCPAYFCQNKFLSSV